MNQKNLFRALIPYLEKGHNIQETKILQLLFEKKMNISQISKTLDIDYKNTHRYIHKLKEAGLVLLSQNKPARGKKVEIILSEKALKEILDELEATLLKKEDYQEMTLIIKETQRKLRFIQLSALQDENKVHS